MSSISSIGSGSQTPFLQQFAQKREADFGAALQTVGVDPSKAGDIQSQIQSAVQDALKNTPEGTDRRSAVQQAVDGVLKDSGIDPAKFHDALKAQAQKSGGHHHGHHRGSKAGSETQGATSPQPAPAIPDGAQKAGSILDLPA